MVNCYEFVVEVSCERLSGFNRTLELITLLGDHIYLIGTLFSAQELVHKNN